MKQASQEQAKRYERKAARLQAQVERLQRMRSRVDYRWLWSEGHYAAAPCHVERLWAYVRRAWRIRRIVLARVLRKLEAQCGVSYVFGVRDVYTGCMREKARIHRARMLRERDERISREVARDAEGMDCWHDPDAGVSVKDLFT